MFQHMHKVQIFAKWMMFSKAFTLIVSEAFTEDGMISANDLALAEGSTALEADTLMVAEGVFVDPYGTFDSLHACGRSSMLKKLAEGSFT